jgi:hypothetical protein
MSPEPNARAAALESLHQEVLRAGEDVRALREVLQQAAPDEAMLVGVLRRAVPVRFLEQVAALKPWSERPAVVAQVVLHPRTPRALALRLLPQLLWRQLADVAAAPQAAAAVRVRAEAALKDQLRDLRLGERVTLARLATPPVIQLLLSDPDPKVLQALLQNRRLREEDLLVALRRRDVDRALIEAASSSPRWSEQYAVRLEIALQPRTPLGVALLQLSSLVPRDLRRVAGAAGLPALVRVAAERLSEPREA